MAYGIDQEFEQALALVQKILEIMLRIQQENKKKVTDQGVKQTAPKEVIDEVDEKMKELNGVKREIKHYIDQPEQSVSRGKNENQELLWSSDEIEQQRNELKKEMDKFIKQLEFAKKELDAINITNPSALQRFSEKLMMLDANIKILNSRINSFFRLIPERLEKSAANFLIGKLDVINEKVLALKDQLSEKTKESHETQKEKIEIREKTVQQEKVDEKSVPLKVIKNESEHFHGPAFRTAREMIANKDEFYLIKDLIVDGMHKEFDSMNTTMEGMIETAIENNQKQISKNSIQNNELTGLKMEIDPKVGSFESMDANKNVKTLASVKDELEEVTLTEYGGKMEASYQAAFDTDPNVATDVTDEEWQLLEDDYWNRQESNCWEPEM